MPQFPTFISRLRAFLPAVLIVTLGLTLAACGGTADEGSAGGDGEITSGRVIGTVSSDLIVIDREDMAELPCHAMDNSIMGECSEDDIAGLLAEMGLDKNQIILHDKQLMSEEACHVMETTIMGNCSEDDVTRLAEEVRAIR